MSVSISHSTSPAPQVSPGFLLHSLMVPWVMVGDKEGIIMVVNSGTAAKLRRVGWREVVRKRTGNPVMPALLLLLLLMLLASSATKGFVNVLRSLLLLLLVVVMLVAVGVLVACPRE